MHNVRGSPILEQLPPFLALRVGPALDLVPHCLGPIRVRLPLGHLSVQDRLLDGELLADPVVELLESLEDVPPLGPEMAALPGDVEQPRGL